MIEVEQRAEVTEQQAAAIGSRLKKEGRQTRSFTRCTLVQIDRSDFEVTTTGTYDLKLRNNEHGQLLFTVKQVNAFNPTTRLESEVLLEVAQLTELLTNLKMLGFIYWIMTVEKRETFESDGATWDIIRHLTTGRTLLEVEVPAASDAEITAAEKRSDELLASVNAKPLSDSALHDILSGLNRAHDYQFDLSVVDTDIVAQRFTESLNK